jgi:alpha/beta hydrolase family protein
MRGLRSLLKVIALSALAVMGIVGTVLVLSPRAAANVTQVVVNQTTVLGNNIEVVGFMEGTAPGGSYSVPVTLLYPISGGSGVGLVDVVNSAGVLAGLPGATDASPPARRQLGDEFISSQGYFYIAVQWYKLATIVTGKGSIAAGTDGNQILKDAADLLRNPSGRFVGLLEAEPNAASVVLASGASQTGVFLRGYLAKGLNADGAFDGVLIWKAGALCSNLSDNPPSYLTTGLCQAPLPKNGSNIVVNTESDIELSLGWLARGPDEIVYEIAGVSHIPPDDRDLSGLGATRQNPVSLGPALRGAALNLTNWVVYGIEPPPSATMPGTVGSLTTPIGPVPIGFPIYVFDRDANGNSLGGVRLPHMAAPLGVYRGIEYNVSAVPANYRLFVAIGGTFTPFSHSKLKELYPHHGTYVSAVAEAAQAALEAGYILEEDRDLYVEEAAHSDIGK